MANVVLNTEEEQSQHLTARVPPPPSSAPVAVVAVEASAAEVAAASAASTASIAVGEARRYDQATTEKALALAAELQHKYDSELTTEQVVGIGEEAHLRPEFILQALAQVEQEAAGSTANDAASIVKQKAARRRLGSRSTGTATAVSSMPKAQRRSQIRLSPRSKQIAAVVPALSTLIAVLLLSGSIGIHLAPAILVLAGGPLLALFTGVAVRSRRLGLVSGFFLGLGMFLAILSVASPYTPTLSEMIVPLLAVSGAGAILGLMGAAAARRRVGGASPGRERLAALLRHASNLLDSPQDFPQDV